jgi:SAM-dependent methyltransferase
MDDGSNLAGELQARESWATAFVKPECKLKWLDDIASVPIERMTPGLRANQTYFDNEEWAEAYLEHVHRDEKFRARWLAATGDWSGKIVVDIGCGPGNVQATLRQKPRVLIGIDVSLGALKLARQFGYETLQADAQDLPLRSGFADLVIVNAAIHHCDDMEQVLKEAARLVGPGGMLVIDHDPQLSAWNFRGLGLALWKSRLWVYRLTKKGFHRSEGEQSVALASEIHHEAGDGITTEFVMSTLEPLGFGVEIFPHNQTVGAEALEGVLGTASLKLRIGQFLSGINPNSEAAALSLMCRAVRTTHGFAVK